MRVKGLSDGIDADHAKPSEVVEQLLVNYFETLAVTLVFGFLVCGKGMLETIDDRNERLHNSRRRALVILGALLFDALPVVVKVRLAAQQCLPQIVKIR